MRRCEHTTLLSDRLSLNGKGQRTYLEVSIIFPLRAFLLVIFYGPLRCTILYFGWFDAGLLRISGWTLLRLGLVAPWIFGVQFIRLQTRNKPHNAGKTDLWSKTLLESNRVDTDAHPHGGGSCRESSAESLGYFSQLRRTRFSHLPIAQLEFTYLPRENWMKIPASF